MSSSFQKSTIVRFKNRGIRALFRTGELLAPRLGGRAARDLWFTVRRWPRTARCHPAASRSRSPRSAPRSAATSGARGPVVYLVHGWAGRGSQLAGFVEPLTAAGFRAVLFDAPAHGDSEPGPAGPGAPTASRWARRWTRSRPASAPRTRWSRTRSAPSRRTSRSATAGSAPAAGAAGPDGRGRVPGRPVPGRPRLRPAHPPRVRAGRRRPGRPADLEFDARFQAAHADPVPTLVVHDRGDRQTPYGDAVTLVEGLPRRRPGDDRGPRPPPDPAGPGRAPRRGGVHPRRPRERGRLSLARPAHAVRWCTKHQRQSSPGSADCMTGCAVSRKCAVACRCGEESQQPTWPQLEARAQVHPGRALARRSPRTRRACPARRRRVRPRSRRSLAHRRGAAVSAARDRSSLSTAVSSIDSSTSSIASTSPTTSCATCPPLRGSPAPGRARRRSSPAGSGSRSRLGVSCSVGCRRAAPRRRSCAGRAASRITSPTPCGSSSSELVELLEPGLGGLVQQRGPGQGVVARVRRGHLEPARAATAGKPLEEQRAGHDGERDQQQHLAVLGVLGDHERRRQRDHAAHAGPAEQERVGPRRRLTGRPSGPGRTSR